MIELITPYPAMLIRKGKKRVLLVADLHIGWEIALAQKGVHIPSQTPKIKEKILQTIEKSKPTHLIFLGDIKHTVTTAELGEWRDIPELFENVLKAVPNVSVIPGNHDGNIEPLLPEGVKLLPSTGVAVGDVGLFHGHAWPAPELLRCRNLVMGHLHPVVVFRDPLGFRITRQVWMKAPCKTAELAKALLKKLNIKVEENPLTGFQESFGVNPKASQLFVLPSLNEFLGGQPVNTGNVRKGRKYKEFIGPILRSGSVEIDQAETYLLDGTFVGTIAHLKEFY